MKYLLFITSSLFLLAACTSAEVKEEKAKTSYLQEESLIPYLLSDTDTVYSIKVVLHSDKPATLAYVAELQQHGITYKDSMIFDLDAGQTVNGQLIFSECRVDTNNEPVLTSHVNVLEH